MKKVSLLLTLLVCLAVENAAAQNGTVNIPLGALRAAYRASFGQNPDFGNYQQLALAINRSKSKYFPGSAGGFWNGRISPNAADHSQDMYGIVTVGQGAVPQNPQAARLRDLRANFGGTFGRLPDFKNYGDLALAIHRYQAAQNVPCSGGFWNGEQSIAGGHDTFSIVWVTTASPAQKIPVQQLAASFEARVSRAPDFNNYRDMVFAVTSWIDDNEKGQALGGFWNGERSGKGPDEALWIVLVK